MILLEVKVTKADATLTHSETLTKGMQNAMVKFTFSDEWAALGKTAKFKAGATSIDVILDGTTSSVCAIPKNALLSSGVNLSVGIYGTGASAAIPTVWCTLGTIHDGTGITPDPEIDQTLYDQVSEKLQETDAALIRGATVEVDKTKVADPSATVELKDNPDTSVGGKILGLTFDGLQGEQGEAGTAATVSVSETVTLEPGNDAKVENIGDETAAVLKFSIPRGDKGEQGDKGDTGDAATIEVGTVTTGAPGTEVVVNNVGDEHAAKFDFTIPKGETGRKGDTGDCCYPEFSVDPSTGRLSVSGADQSSLSYTVNSNGHLEVELL